MGAWGTGPLENDEALDFVETIRRAKKDARLAKAVAAIAAYADLDRRLAAGENVTTLSEADVAALWKSRDDTLALYAAQGTKPPRFLRMATEAEYAQVVAELAAPQVQDGVVEGTRLLAVAQLLDDALAGRRGPLAHHDRGELAAAAHAAAAAIGRLLENPLFAATWRPDDFARLTVDARRRAAGLAAAV